MTDDEKKDIIKRINDINNSLSMNPNYIRAIISQREEAIRASERHRQWENERANNCEWRTSPGI